MIVKNEEHIIERALESVKDIVDYYIISDTGSSDLTPKIIKEFMDQHNISGEIHFDKWLNYGHNRNYNLLHQPKSDIIIDYNLLLDADETVVIHNLNDFYRYMDDGVDGLNFLYKNNNLKYFKTKLISTSKDWIYKGKTHEYITTFGHFKKTIETDLAEIIEYYDGGNRSTKFENDVKILERELEINPNDRARHLFYLGRSYYDLKNYKKAIENFEKCKNTTKWDEELYQCYLYRGLGFLQLDQPGNAAKELIMSYIIRPTRIEGLYYLISHYIQNNQHYLAYPLVELIKDIKLPSPDNDILFVHNDVYEWKFFAAAATVYYKLGMYDKANYCFNEIKHLDNGWVKQNEKFF
ncbi:MAG: glycosyltransferase [bacterium]